MLILIAVSYLNHLIFYYIFIKSLDSIIFDVLCKFNYFHSQSYELLIFEIFIEELIICYMVPDIW